MAKRLLLILVPLLLILSFFWRPIFETTTGWTIRAILAYNQWYLSFSELHWSDGGFHFTNVRVDAPGIFFLEGKKASLSVKTKSIEIESAYLKMDQWTFEDDWPDWKISIYDGVIEEKTIGIARFFMERIHPDQIIHVIFERNGSELSLEALREPNQVRLLAEWKSVDLRELNRWIETGNFSDGKSDGKGEILFEEGKKKIKAHLALDSASYAWGFWKGEGISAICDWEGPLGISSECAFRGEVSKGRGSIGEKSFPIRSAKLTSFPHVGAKIELQSEFFLSAKTVYGIAPWLEAKLEFPEAFAAIRENEWSCQNIGSVEVGWLQTFLAPFFPEIAPWTLENGRISAKGSWGEEGFRLNAIDAQEVKISQDKWQLALSHLQGNDEHLFFEGASFETPFMNGTNWQGNTSFQQGEFEGKINDTDLKIELLRPGTAEVRIKGPLDGVAKVGFGWKGNQLEAAVSQASLGVEFSKFKLDQLSMQLTISKEEIHCYNVRGELASIPLFIPHFALRGPLWAFDFRVEGAVCDSLRLWGTGERGTIEIDSAKSHLFGRPVQVDSFIATSSGLKKLQMEATVPFFSYLEGTGELTVDFEEGASSSIALKGEAIDFCVQREGNGAWELSHCRVGEWLAGGNFDWKDQVLQIVNGYCKGPDWQANVEGKFAFGLTGSTSMNLSNLSLIWPEKKIEGSFQGEGRFEEGRFDFDFTSSILKIDTEQLQNRGPVQICYSDREGLLVRGIDLHNRDWRCKVGLLQYDRNRSRWISNHSQLSIPPKAFTYLNLSLPVPLEKSIELIADLEWIPRSSIFQGKMKEGFVSIGGALFRDLRFTIREKEATAQLQWLFDGRPFTVGFNMNWEQKIRGTLHLHDEEREQPLLIDWGLAENRAFELYRVEGDFEGIGASFYRDLNGGLVGTLRLDFSLLESFLPPPIQALKLGDGYELKGRFSLDPQGPIFKGILAGKEMEAAGYRFKTLFAQVEWGADQFTVSNCKLSDSAGIVQFGHLRGTQTNGAWKVEMPQLTIQELRPSLLQKIGETLGPMSPLIIREFKITDFEGTLGKPETFQAHGHLAFINSYRRIRTMYDLPADVLGHIVGLDQELLIPAFGTIHYEMKEGRVNLTGLADTFSQGSRSQFFLVNEEPPYIDLNGQIHILVKMKQFVLFKFTEFFLISIGGTVTEPEIRLQKKKGLFGF